MKKILVLMLMLCMPVLTVDAENEPRCDGNKFNQILKEIEDITFEYEYLKEGSTNFLGQDISGKFKVTSPNMPQNVLAYFFGSDGIGNIVGYNTYSALSGGVYTVKFTHSECASQVVKAVEIFIPLYNEFEDEDAWFDGTYENKLVNHEEEDEDKIDVMLIVILVVLITTIILGAIFIFIRKRRNIKWTEK